jgi:hypothetical protein
VGQAVFKLSFSNHARFVLPTTYENLVLNNNSINNRLRLIIELSLNNIVRHMMLKPRIQRCRLCNRKRVILINNTGTSQNEVTFLAKSSTGTLGRIQVQYRCTNGSHDDSFFLFSYSKEAKTFWITYCMQHAYVRSRTKESK